MEWYYILFFSALVFFIMKFILSMVAGDVDIDFDADGDVDFDISSLLSFKGALHFLLGFSSYLSIVAKVSGVSGTYDFSIGQYILAVLVGAIFMVVLYRVYLLMMKLNSSSTKNYNLEGCSCTIRTNLGNCKYEVLVKIPSGTVRRVVRSQFNNPDLPVGPSYLIIKVDGEYVI